MEDPTQQYPQSQFSQNLNIYHRLGFFEEVQFCIMNTGSFNTCHCNL